MPELVIVGSFANHIEAEIAQGALEAAGIKSVSSADGVGGQYANLLLTGGGVRLSVEHEDVAAAKAILNRSRVPRPPDHRRGRHSA